jgi:hypothetical protein
VANCLEKPLEKNFFVSTLLPILVQTIKKSSLILFSRKREERKKAKMPVNERKVDEGNNNEGRGFFFRFSMNI